MNRFISADYVFPVSEKPIVQGVVEIDSEGQIQQIYKDRRDLPQHANIESFKGILVPGFVNAHCHLELSHLKGKIKRGQGLVTFILDLMRERKKSDAEEIQRAMVIADAQMHENGIVAVGDHANTTESVAVKKASPIYYHTFLELIGFDPNDASEAIEQANSKWMAYKSAGLAGSISPHAPYSVSKELFLLFRRMNANSSTLLSIHNQETAEENLFFRYKTGDILRLYDKLGINTDLLKPSFKSSLTTYGLWLPKASVIQLVHNTFTKSKEMNFVRRIGLNVRWCLCPNANLYIEEALPKLEHFMQDGAELTLGTDSLASNEQLCILSEMKQLHFRHEELTLHDSLKWATLNGAKFLGIQDTFGTLEVGKTPGLLLLDHIDELTLTPETTVRRLI